MAAVQDTFPGLKCLTHLTTINMNQTSAGRIDGCNYAVLREDEVLFNLTEDCSNHGMFTGASRRGFHMDGVDNAGRKVFTLRRPAMSMSDKVELYMNNALVSVVRMKTVFMTANFSINDAQDCRVLRLKGEGMFDNGCNFQLQTNTKITIGSVEKIHRGWRNEILSRKDDYIITFPADLAVQFKLAVVVATVLIDFRFHEHK